MLHYPHLVIPEETFTWIYPLSIQLEPKAELYCWEDHQRDIKETWDARLKGKEHQTYGESAELEALCKPLLKQYPRIDCFFTYLIDAYLMQSRMEYASQLVEARKQWMIKHPYKILSQLDLDYGIEPKIITESIGHTYISDMSDWVGAMRTLQFFEIDIQKKIADGFVFRPRPRRKS